MESEEINDKQLVEKKQKTVYKTDWRGEQSQRSDKEQSKLAGKYY